MGDYGVGLQSLSPVDFNRFVNNQSLFSPENSPRTMQDEVLLEKSAAKQQQLSPSCNQISDHNGDALVKNGHADIVTSAKDDKNAGNLNNSASNIETNSQLITSLAVSQSFWTPPQVHEDTFSQGAFQNMNGSVSFQHLPPNVIVNTGNYMQAAHLSSHSSLSQRRAITAQHNFPQQRPIQQGMILNSAKNYPQWSNAHSQAHATLSPWTQAQLQQHHQHQRRSVPNMNIPAFAHLKNIKTSFPQSQQSLSIIAPSKFRRSTSYPSQIHQATYAKPNIDYVGLDEMPRESYLSYQV